MDKFVVRRGRRVRPGVGGNDGGSPPPPPSTPRSLKTVLVVQMAKSLTSTILAVPFIEQ